MTKEAIMASLRRAILGLKLRAAGFFTLITHSLLKKVFNLFLISIRSFVDIILIFVMFGDTIPIGSMHQFLRDIYFSSSDIFTS